MAPTESTILANYLLVPSQLPTIISLKEFTGLFPRSQQSSAQVRKLYRDLQNQRNALIDEVLSNIETEVKKGKVLRREVLRARREAEEQEIDDEIDIERACIIQLLIKVQLYGVASGVAVSKHNINSIIPELDSSAEELDAAIQSLEKEEAELLQSIKQTVGSMSDLRYGRLSNGQLRKQVLEGLQIVQETCGTK
ncbi:hypothetical protein VPNG_07877 [Cytospora leucostoma]|uniref:Cnl2/NKP2 family protein n=1 Tax=Cytospora leucostoma TaxID=1230097 RepID=A0A423WGW2_9PEZI|nr:hypothetical protein VPNG_07877 [Cytospora leucostoma]